VRLETKRLSRSPAIVTFAVLAFACLACGSERLVIERDELIVERRPDPAYDALFPTYVELCAVSQFRPKEKGLGGVPGHAVMYLKGACKDEDAPYPRLRRCRRAATDPYDAEHGVGVSVNRWLRNVNWIAIPGNALFYAGNLRPGERLTREHFEATVRGTIERGVFHGIELRENPAWPDQRLQTWVERSALGTDFALQFARSVFCARLPVTDEMLTEVMDFLNQLNDEYATGEAEYQWSGFYDNCVHALRNALAAAGIWEPLSVRAIKFRQIFNLAIPANEFVNLARLGAEGPIDDYPEVYAERSQQRALMELGWLPTRHGALVKTLPVHENNDLYDRTLRLFVLQSPLRRRQVNDVVRLLSDPRYVELDANLAHFARRYADILAGRNEGGLGLSSLRGDRYRRVRRRYYSYIEEQRAEVERLRGKLQTLPAVGGTSP